MARRPSRKREPIDFPSLRGKVVRSYVRESTERQAGADHYGPDLQRAGIRQFCDMQGINQPEREYFDAASGRSTTRRTQLQQALEQAPDYDVLVFFHSSRSFRNQHDAVLWKRQFRDAGVTLVFAQQQIISLNPEHRIQEGFYELIDEQRSVEAGMMIASALRQKHLRGGVNGKPPLGYRRYHGEPGDPLNGSLLLDEDGAATVRRIFDLYLEGNSIRSLVTVANAEGLRTRLGRPFTKGSIEEILRNRTYTGEAIWAPGTADEETLPGAHEAIIDTEMFEAVERQRRERRTRTNPSRNRAFRVYPLTNRSECFYCGASFFGDTGSRSNKRRMRHAAGTCDYRRSMSADELEEQARQLVVTRLSLNQIDIEEMAREVVAAPKPRDVEAAERLHETLERTKQLYRWGDITEDEYRRERTEIDRRLREVEPREPIELQDVRVAAEWLSHLGELWTARDQEGRRDIANHLFTDVRIGERGIKEVNLEEPYRGLLAACGRAGRGGRIQTGNLDHLWTPWEVLVGGVDSAVA